MITALKVASLAAHAHLPSLCSQFPQCNRPLQPEKGILLNPQTRMGRKLNEGKTDMFAGACMTEPQYPTDHYEHH